MNLELRIAQDIQRNFRRDAAIKRVSDKKRSDDKKNVHREHLVQLTTDRE